MRTLYISDLDGTLLHPNAEVSEYTIRTLNNLIEKKMFFTVATARTPATAIPMTAKLKINAPIILMNGVLVFDRLINTYIKVERISYNDVNEIIKLIKPYNLSGFMYTLENNIMNTYYEELLSEASRIFHDERVRKFNKSFTKINSFYDVDMNNVIYFSFLDKKDLLQPLCDSLEKLDGIHVEFYRDVYSEDLWFLEISSARASKYNAVKFLREEYGFDKVVCFGDNLNDLPMFNACDECYAVLNAREEVKNKATAVIGGNWDDGVAKWVEKIFA